MQNKRQRHLPTAEAEIHNERPKDFLDITAPGAVRFYADHFILGNTYRTVLAIRGYPTGTEELALLRHLGAKSGVTLSIYARRVSPAEEHKILHDAANKNRMSQAGANDLKTSVTAGENLRDVAALDELYIWLSNRMTIEYIRNTLKRVRKKESALIMASQNLEDFSVDGIRELTRPLFAIPTHQFIFHCGAVDKRFYMDNLQLEQSEYELIRYPQRGVCLYKCGVERFLLEVHAPKYKEALFGAGGGQ